MEVAAQMGPAGSLAELATAIGTPFIEFVEPGNVADILAFSACKTAIIAFKTTGSSGKVEASFDMVLITKNHA